MERVAGVQGKRKMLKNREILFLRSQFYTNGL
jgi:hypothetical protein